MTAEPANALSLQLRRAAGLTQPDSPTDSELIERFLSRKDEPAFAELVRRHGPMVFAVCRRVAGNPHDADDAFQATFLVLARKARGLPSDVRLGAWLHGVAHRAALKAREAAVRRRTRETAAARPEGIAAADEQIDVLAVIEQELNHLPEKYRQPLVLCGLCGQSRKEVAAQLGVPEGTLASRLAKAREMLTERLHRRGLVVPASAVALACDTQAAQAAVPTTLIEAAAKSASGTLPATVTRIATEVTRAMFLRKFLTGLLALVAMTLVSAAGALTLSAATARPEASNAPPTIDPPKREQPKPVAKGEKPDPPGTVGLPIPGEPAWKAEFRKAYGLEEKQTVKLIPSPFPACRESYYDFQEQPREGRVPPERMLIAFVQDGPRIRISAMASRHWIFAQPGGDEPGWPLRKFLEHGMGILDQEIEGDKTLLSTLVDADIVVRKKADEKQLLKDLQSELLDKCGVRVKFDLREEEREVVIATGKYTLKRGADGELPIVDVYASNTLEEPSSTHSSGTEKLLAHLGEFIGRRVIDQTDVPSRDVALKHRYHQRRPVTPETTAADTDPEKVLKNVAEQTGLTFKTEKRKVRVLFIEKDEK